MARELEACKNYKRDPERDRVVLALRSSLAPTERRDRRVLAELGLAAHRHGSCYTRTLWRLAVTEEPSRDAPRLEPLPLVARDAFARKSQRLCRRPGTRNNQGSAHR